MFGDAFRDAIVIIGGNAAGLHDLRKTPLSHLHPAADILATALDNLLHDDWLRRVPESLVLLAGLLLLAAITWAFHAGRGLPAGGAMLIAASVIWLALAWWLLGANRYLPVMAVPAWALALYVALGLYQVLHERARRDAAVNAFGRFIDPRVVKSLVREDSDALRAPPQSREITVLFSDIRGFTTLSETRPPEEIVDLLNRYFARQVEVIFRHGGTIDKFIGDAIMAFWGAPVEDPRQAEHAVRAALKMMQVANGFRAELAARGIDFDIGIGLNTGPAVVGFIGADNRLDYTAIGDTVNLASRIEGLTSRIARVLVSDETRRRCGEVFGFIDHGEFQVKGRAQPVRLHEPRGEGHRHELEDHPGMRSRMPVARRRACRHRHADARGAHSRCAIRGCGESCRACTGDRRRGRHARRRLVPGEDERRKRRLAAPVQPPARRRRARKGRIAVHLHR